MASPRVYPGFILVVLRGGRRRGARRHGGIRGINDTAELERRTTIRLIDNYMAITGLSLLEAEPERLIKWQTDSGLLAQERCVVL